MARKRHIGSETEEESWAKRGARLSEVSDDDLIPLDEAAKYIPGADAGTLKRRARAGKLTVYRPGKAYLTTGADLRRMIAACRVEQKVRHSGSAPPVTTKPEATTPFGLSEMELAKSALDSVLARARSRSAKR